MIDSRYLGSLRSYLHTHALVRRDVIKEAGDALHHSKRAVFSLHRGDAGEAQKKLKEAEEIFLRLNKKYKQHPAFQDEGSYRAAIEEYVEATLFLQFVMKGKIGKVTTVGVDGDVYLAGLCDVPGELYRYAIRAATMHDHKTVEACVEMANKIIGELVEFDLTSYLRTKFDQAKQATQKLEIVMYELALREKNNK